MKVKIRGRDYNLAQEELEFVKKIYGYWEERDGVLIFDAPKMLSMGQMCRELGITRQAVHDRNRRNPKKYPLYKMGSNSYIFESELEGWKNRKGSNRRLE